MVTEVTNGIKVTVKTSYQPAYSSPQQRHFVFTYEVTIENNNEYTIQLLRRHWHIYDSDTTYKEVDAEGVIGQQPVIEPGQVHQYYSGCNLKTSMGKMKGTYLMERLIDGKQFEAIIPEFPLIAPFRFN